MAKLHTSRAGYLNLVEETGYESKDKKNGAADYLGSSLTDSILCFLFTTVTFYYIVKIKMTACKETSV